MALREAPGHCEKRNETITPEALAINRHQHLQCPNSGAQQVRDQGSSVPRNPMAGRRRRRQKTPVSGAGNRQICTYPYAHLRCMAAGRPAGADDGKDRVRGAARGVFVGHGMKPLRGPATKGDGRTHARLEPWPATHRTSGRRPQPPHPDDLTPSRRGKAIGAADHSSSSAAPAGTRRIWRRPSLISNSSPGCRPSMAV